MECTLEFYGLTLSLSTPLVPYAFIFCAFNFPGNPALKEEGTSLPRREGRMKEEGSSAPGGAKEEGSAKEEGREGVPS